MLNTCVRLRFGLGVTKDVLASLYLHFNHFLRCQGSFGTGDMEFTTANIHIIRMGEHHPPCLQGSVREWCDAELIPRPRLQHASRSYMKTQPPRPEAAFKLARPMP